MSDVKRYTFDEGFADRAEDGDYVLASDYDALSARCEELERRLAEERDTTPIDGKFLRELGGTRPMAPASEEVYVFGEWRSRPGTGAGIYPIQVSKKFRGEWALCVGGYDVDGVPTRGDVRTAMRLLKIAQPTTNGARR